MLKNLKVLWNSSIPLPGAAATVAPVVCTFNATSYAVDVLPELFTPAIGANYLNGANPPTFVLVKV